MSARAELDRRITDLTAARSAQRDARAAAQAALHQVEQARRAVIVAERAVTEQIDKIADLAPGTEL